MAKISVIIPAYNAETTLRTAVESILSQQVPELEIIIVNDGSTDGTDRLCHALASEYPCIYVITQKNARHLRGPQPRHGGCERGVHHLL